MDFHNMGVGKGGGGYDEPRTWDPHGDGPFSSSYPEDEQTILSDGKEIGYNAAFSFYTTSVVQDPILDTAAPSPETSVCSDIRTMPGLTRANEYQELGISEMDFRSLNGPAIYSNHRFEALGMGPQYPLYIDDSALHPFHRSSMTSSGAYNPRHQSLDSCMATTIMPMACGGGGYASEEMASPHPPNIETRNTFRRASDSGNIRDRKSFVSETPKKEDMPLPKSIPEIPPGKKETPPAQVEVKEEPSYSKDKSDVAPKKRKRSRKGSVCEHPSGEEPLFACPLYRMYPLQNMDCVNRKLTRIRDVKQHLFRRHLAFRCPICKSAFPSAARKDEHIQERNCTRSESTDLVGPDGIPQEIHDQLRERSHRGKPATIKWMEVWEIIFGDTSKAEEPFLRPMMDETARLMRNIWIKERTLIVQEVILDPNSSQNETEQQRKAMMDMFDKVQARFEMRISELTNVASSSENSPLMSASQTIAKTKTTTSGKQNTQNTCKVSPQPDGGVDSNKPEVHVQSGIQSLPADSGSSVSHYTLNSTPDPRYGCAEHRPKGHSNTWPIHTPHTFLNPRTGEFDETELSRMTLGAPLLSSSTCTR